MLEEKTERKAKKVERVLGRILKAKKFSKEGLVIPRGKGGCARGKKKDPKLFTEGLPRNSFGQGGVTSPQSTIDKKKVTGKKGESEKKI